MNVKVAIFFVDAFCRIWNRIWNQRSRYSRPWSEEEDHSHVNSNLADWGCSLSTYPDERIRGSASSPCYISENPNYWYDRVWCTIKDRDLSEFKVEREFGVLGRLRPRPVHLTECTGFFPIPCGLASLQQHKHMNHAIEPRAHKHSDVLEKERKWNWSWTRLWVTTELIYAATSLLTWKNCGIYNIYTLPSIYN